MKKPTGRSGMDPNDRVNCCIEIQMMILDKDASGILGASSVDENRFSPSPPSSPSESSWSPTSDGEVVPGTEVQGMDVNLFDSPVLLQPPASPWVDMERHYNEAAIAINAEPSAKPPLLQSTIKKLTEETMLKYPWPMREQLCRVLLPDKTVSHPVLPDDPLLVHQQEQTR